jgi:hypothetical protein
MQCDFRQRIGCSPQYITLRYASQMRPPVETGSARIQEWLVARLTGRITAVTMVLATR